VGAITTKPPHIDTNGTAKSGKQLRLATLNFLENFHSPGPIRG
jgi:hypothetical protein